MRKFTALFLGILLVLVLVACGDNNGDSKDANNADNNENNNTNTNEQVDNDDGEEITLRMAWWGDQPRTDYTLEVIKLFEEENPNIKIDPEYAGWDDDWESVAPQRAANERADISNREIYNNLQ